MIGDLGFWFLVLGVALILALGVAIIEAVKYEDPDDTDWRDEV